MASNGPVPPHGGINAAPGQATPNDIMMAARRAHLLQISGMVHPESRTPYLTNDGFPIPNCGEPNGSPNVTQGRTTANRCPLPAKEKTILIKPFKSLAMVTFLVGKGESQQKFIVHKSFACHQSPVFNVAFNKSSYIEHDTQTYKLPDAVPSSFAYFTEYLYTNNINIAQLQSDFDLTQAQHFQESEQEQKDLVGLWILAQQFLMPKLQNLVVTKFQEIVVNELPIHGVTLCYIYEKTEGEDFDNKLRYLAVRHLYFNHTRANAQAYRGLLPRELLDDVLAFRALVIPKLGINSPISFNGCKVAE